MEENKEHIIAQWLEGSISDEELDKQYDTDMSNDLRMIQDATADMDVPSMDSAALLTKIKSDIHQPKQAKVSYLKYWVSAIAAMLIAVLAYTSLTDGDYVDINNDTLGYVSHTLPDGSVIMLNANSKINYSPDFRVNRKINLIGEAFFQVEKGNTFKVHTDNGDVEVLGTSFNVFARGDNLSVACKTGRVQVTTQSETILNSGHQVTSIKGKELVANIIDIDYIGTWQHGESKYKSTPIGEVILAIGAQYGYEVNMASIDASQKFTGSFVHDDIDKAIRMVFLPMGISYEMDTENKIISIH